MPNPTQHGVVWSTSANPTIADSKTTDGDVTLTGAFTSSITGLTPGMLYHVRAYATNAVGTVYGDDVTFTTLPSATGTTTPVTNAGTGTNVRAGTGTADWANPGNITADDTSYASATLTGSVQPPIIWKAPIMALPFLPMQPLMGFQVTIGRHESGTRAGNFDVRDSMVSLLKDGGITGNNKAATGTEWPTAPPVPAVYGTPTDLWGTTWTPADINANDFGVALSVISDINRIAYVDYMQISVTYTVTMVSSTTTVNCGAGTPVVTYGSNITCVATVVRGSGTNTPTGNVSWTTNGSGNFVTSPCVLSGSDGTATCSVTYTPNSVGSGSHLITATYAGDPNFFSSNGNQTVTVNKAPATVNLSNLVQVYDGTPKEATVMIDPAGLSVSVTYDGSTTPPTAVGSYAVVATVTDPNYTGSASGTFVIQAKHSITLVPGWNLVSFNVHPTDTSPAAVLADIAGHYDLVYAWDATGAHSSSGNWLKYDPAVPPFLNSLTILDEQMGFWIHMTVADTLDVVGSAPVSTEIELLDNTGGWNLVSYASISNRALPGALEEHGVGTDFSLVYTYQASEPGDPWKLFDRSAPPFLNDLTQLTPGRGYWVKVNADHTWTILFLPD